MSDVDFELDTNSFKINVLQADWMLDYVESEAQARAGADEHVKAFIGYDRAKAIIYPDTKENPG